MTGDSRYALRAQHRPFDLEGRLREVQHELMTYDAVRHIIEIVDLLCDMDPTVAATRFGREVSVAIS